jgi:hypothetical protein
MGINVQLETERGLRLREVPDPRGYVEWLLGMAGSRASLCLQFIDPYGDTVFNGLQLPVLKAELGALESLLTDPGLADAKSSYLQQALSWPERARQEAATYVASLRLVDLQHHLRELLRLLDQALQSGPHHYVRFVGD